MLSFLSSRMSFIYPLFLTWKQIGREGYTRCTRRSFVMIVNTEEELYAEEMYVVKSFGSRVVSDSV